MIAAFLALAALPWLSGFEPAATADRGEPDVVQQLEAWQPVDDDCVASAYGGLSLSADVAAPAGDETVLASYSQGIVVLDPEGHAIARAPGFTCRGSADDLVAIAAGDAGVGVPLVALAATTGGHAESITWLTLYRVDRGQLVPVFTGVVEQQQGKRTQTGAVFAFPGGLIFRPPGGSVSVWLYDREAGRYVEQTVPDGVA